MVAASLLSPVDRDTTAGHDPFSQTLTPVHILQNHATGPVVSLPRPVVQLGGQGTSMGPAEKTCQAAHNNAKMPKKPSADHDSNKRKVSYKIPRYTRRNQSRSEPSNKT